MSWCPRRSEPCSCPGRSWRQAAACCSDLSSDCSSLSARPSVRRPSPASSADVPAETARGHCSAPERADRLDRLIERRGLWAVVGQKFIPGISDALASYAFGAFGVPLWQIAVGAFIGSVPRAFVYTALGASIGDLSSPLAYAAIAIWCVTAVAGAFATHQGYRQMASWPLRTHGTDQPLTVKRVTL